ncbi:hypothetical protein BDQ17DRAFT_1425201 [Cyathus striatus]|nr:hypothetical protein BDQ17DRAFT_1425201 [Cyathus striatus]
MATSTPTTSKRHSLAISTGPKPLHLITKAPSTAPHTTSTFNIHTPSPPYSPLSPLSANRHHHKGKRQSSISYISSHDGIYSPGEARHAALSRSSSLLQRSVGEKKGKDDRDRRSAGSAIGGEEKKRPPLTLAEKHADLLQFIAQKESKCLELRSQLAMHEAELLQLKRKWERIVNRGFERDQSTYPTSSPPTSTQTLAGLTSPTLVEGIKEGVQGMSRLFASGLASSSTTHTYPLSPAPTPPLVRTHQTKPSISTASSSSYTSKSTRLSLSSRSSIGEEECKGRGEGEENVLIVRDTGATPTMSPNPDWIRERAKREQEQIRAVATEEATPRLSLGSEHEEEDTFTSGLMREKKLRRRSGGTVAPLLLDEQHLNAVAEDEKRKRALVASFPPVTSIPGLGSFGSAGASGGWVESMGKKLGEFRGGASFTKSQKRASVLISDVSQSFLSALSSPSPGSATSAHSSFPNSSSTFNSSLRPPSNKTKTTSLLDDDDDFTSSSISPVLQPSPAFTPPMVPTRKAALSAGGANATKSQDEEDEWNW